MKFPFPCAPFGNYPALSQALSEQIELIVQQTLTKALTEYEVHQQRHRRALPLSQYKIVKKFEHLVCYRQRYKAASAASSSSSSSLSSSAPCKCEDSDTAWQTSKLVTTGTMIGTLDDAMYGLLATDVTSTFIRASYTKEELLDSELLYCIESPTAEKPFQFCGVKWHLMELSKVATKRDFMFVEATGIVVHPNGERVGYHIRHSVDLPGLGELSGQYQVLRARIVSCNLFRQLSNNKVDVYMTGFVDPNGHVPAAVATAFTASALLKLGQAVECSRSKKLEYLVEQQQLKRMNVVTGSYVKSSGDDDGPTTSAKYLGSSTPCAVCAATLHMFRSVAHCELCFEAVCSRCRVTRRLSYRVARPKELKHRNTVFCTACVAKALTYSAIEVARAELTGQSCRKNTYVIPGPLRRVVTSSTHSSTSSVVSSSAYARQDVEKSVNLPRHLKNSSILEWKMPTRKRSLTHPCLPLDNDHVMELAPTSEENISSSKSDDRKKYFCDNVVGRKKTPAPKAHADQTEFKQTDPLASSMPPRPTASAMESQKRRQHEWLQRMKELRQNAESVYQFTRKNTDSMGCGSTLSKSQSVCFTAFDLDAELD